MNRNRKRVVIPPDCVERGLQFGRDMAAWYASPEGRRSASRAVSGNRGTESNPHRLAQGKIGECALALYLKLGLDAVKWDFGKPDDGADLILLNRVRVDVKTTPPPFRLIWSNNINHIYEKKNFDVLVAVSISDDFAICWVEGWINKGRFFACKQIANGSNGNLEPGTWFVEKSILSNIDDLPFLYLHFHSPIWNASARHLQDAL